MGSEKLSDQSIRQPEIVGGVVAALTRVVVAAALVVAGRLAGEPGLAEADGEDWEESGPAPGEALPTSADTDGGGSATAATDPHPVIAARRGMPRQARTRADRVALREAMLTSPIWIPGPTLQFPASRDPHGERGLSRRIEGGHGA